MTYGTLMHHFPFSWKSRVAYHSAGFGSSCPLVEQALIFPLDQFIYNMMIYEKRSLVSLMLTVSLFSFYSLFFMAFFVMFFCLFFVQFLSFEAHTCLGSPSVTFMRLICLTADASFSFLVSDNWYTPLLPNPATGTYSMDIPWVKFVFEVVLLPRDLTKFPAGLQQLLRTSK